MVIRLLLAAIATGLVSAYECHICRSPYRYISYPDTVVDTGGDIFTCQELSDFATNGEFGPQSCGIAQSWSEKMCGCAGAPITPPPIISLDACLICEEHDKIVGQPNKWVDTSLGPWECAALYDAGLEGYLPPTICRIMQQEAAGPCGCREQYPSATPTSSPAPTYEGQLYQERDEEIPPLTLKKPSPAPSLRATPSPSITASSAPTKSPTNTPSISPTTSPSISPTTTPTVSKVPSSSVAPSSLPTASPSMAPSSKPSLRASSQPTREATQSPTLTPTFNPTLTPTFNPTSSPTVEPPISSATERTGSDNAKDCMNLSRSQGGGAGGVGC
mmetsp:Transcript_9778/g.14061  ORF Transcript_9778/g.14061 Transcript_9778/m.14061 type:complete len:331 (-) Transcript_9778:47-1039(-)|eukprot:CAMPEP_0202456448 /NCGR_PEP_ID=MMETSP1360-20130828/13699_1 /ASSEMBLY_ACC=CAM_ASM_000848 /TAXON_ID=515479 /ORGANISM="Licmophora paradoxa, Strain CCMP2313" /LENGTH=330 /DNA_ID=CAMNT_0049076251 /DNA_START=43 /DNA_END=1035 /DNA_ORIENTATION=+